MSEMPAFNPNLGSEQAHDELQAKRDSESAELAAAQAARIAELNAMRGVETPQPAEEVETPESQQKAA